MGPFTGHKGQFFIDHKDDAVRGALVLDQGVMMWPAPSPAVRNFFFSTAVCHCIHVSVSAHMCP